MINSQQTYSANLSKLEASLGKKFHSIELLAQAMRHPSLLNEQPKTELQSYERLEFLGDSFLGWVIAKEIYKKYPNYPEGELTKARALLVKGSNLQKMAKYLDLGSFMEMGHGEETNGGRDRSSNLAAVFESLVGAILLDQGEEAASKFILKLFSGQINALSITESFNDAKSALQEFLQKHGLPLPLYKLISATGPSHAKLFKIEIVVNDTPVAEATASKKNTAEQQAAKAALLVLQNQIHDLQSRWR
ncbi:MAG: ribonuclease III [Chloroflexi bacterium]|nr:ribonuclease III [Chloroflexota bacterium]